MATRTYVVGGSRGVRRLDDLTLPWQSVNLDVTPTAQAIDLWDVMTDPNDPDKVFVVGSRFYDQGLYGLYYSTDAGVTWQQPTGGDITTTACRSSIFIEVWVVDSNTIYICGDQGNVLKSIDGGATFNLTTTCPGAGCNESNEVVFSIHFPDALNGVVCYDNGSAESYVSTTNDGGATWVNVDVSFLFVGYTGRGLGVHMSADAQTITALHERRIIRSTDGGTTWTQVIFQPGPNSFWRHLSWTDDSNLWAYGQSTTRFKSSDGGATWTVLSGEYGSDGIGDHLAGHNYNLTDGFYSEDSETYETGDGAVTGSLSDTTNTDPPVSKQFTTIRAIWTQFETPSTEPCGCPEGYTYNVDTGLCELEEQIAPLCDETLEVCPVVLAGCCPNSTDQYGRGGAYFYEDATSRPLPISEVPDTDVLKRYALEDSSGVVLNLDPTIPGLGVGFEGIIQNTLWGGEGDCTGRIPVVGVWTSPNNCSSWANNEPIHQWIGFAESINVPVAATYSIGFASDDYVRITIDGQLFTEMDVSSFAWKAWHVIPITLSAGTHNIVIEGYNVLARSFLGAEIYSAAPALLSGLTTPAALAPYIEYSTADRVGTTFDLAGPQEPGASGKPCGGCECPPGYTMTNISGELVCIRTDEVPFEPCGCYLITNCEDPEETQLVSIDPALDPLDLTLIYVFDFDLTKCWTIEESVDCPYDNPISVVSASYASCELCLGICYKLTDCESGEIIYVNNATYAEYVGNTIRVNYEVATGVFEIRCYTVEEVRCPEVTIPSIGEILDCFDNCEDCLPKPVAPVLDIRNRTVKPGYNTPACTPAYYDKVSCKFANAMYVKMSKTRFGIEFDCADDEERWIIKYELLKLKSIETEDACTTISNPCCPPCNVVAELTPPTFPCEPPTDVTSILIVPSPKDCRDVTFTGYLDRKAEVRFYDCNGNFIRLSIATVQGIDYLYINGILFGPFPDVGVSYCVDLFQPYSNENFEVVIGDPCP